MKCTPARTRFFQFLANVCRKNAAPVITLLIISHSAYCEDLSAKLEAILQREAKGEVVDRAQALQGDSKGESDLSNWLAGKVYVGNRWSDVSELNQGNMPKRISRYLAQREKTTLDLDGHRSLARWCSKENLETQAKAHWTAVCDLSANDAEARQELGHKWIGGRWISPEQWNTADKLMQERLANYRKWIPKIKGIVTSIQGTDTKAKSKALETLRLIKDDDAIQSLAAAAVMLDGDQARPFVSAIRRFHSKEACLALAKIAITDPISVAAKEAIEGMKEYRPEFYVRDLLGLVEDDVKFTSRISARPTGELVLEQLWARDTSNEKTVVAIDTVLQAAQKNINTTLPANDRWGRMAFEPTGLGRFSWKLDGRQTTSDLAKRAIQSSAEDSLTRNKDLVSQQNARNEDDRERVFAVLKACLDIDKGMSANDWWNWWDSENDSNYIQARDQNYQYVRDDSYAIQPVSVTAAPPVPRHECLTAGTLIQTENGLKPIESIKIGDMVLSQNVESAAIELKPVLKTTVRDPAPIVEIKTTEDTIQATRGHYWWVSGKGWRRTRELEKDWVVHTATGSVRIVSVEPLREPAVTYNLIVADNHSYFVGDSRLLSNDATELDPSLLPVPCYRHAGKTISTVSVSSSKRETKR